MKALGCPPGLDMLPQPRDWPHAGRWGTQYVVRRRPLGSVDAGNGLLQEPQLAARNRTAR
jgi:hypothetical protein